MKNRCLTIIIVFIGLLSLVPSSQTVSSQADQPLSCPELVALALDTAEIACEELSGHRVCYGHVLVDARPQPGIESLNFESVGDIVDVLDVQSMRLSAMSLLTNQWGVALMNVQTHDRFATPEDVILLLYGDVEINNRGETPVLIAAQVNSREYVNVRITPNTNAGALAVLAPHETIMANGRLEDSSWIRITIPGSDRVGWLHGSLVASDDDLEQLDVIGSATPYYGPMQAFYLESGVDDSLCAEAPESGLLIQTPEGVARVTLLVNEVNIELDATAFVQAQRGNEMSVEVLDGWAEVESFGTSQQVPAGTRVRIPMSSSLTSAGPPGTPEPGGGINPLAIPFGLLDHYATVADPLTPAQIRALLAQSLSDSTETVTTLPETGVTDPNATTEGADGGGGGRCDLDGICEPGENLDTCADCRNDKVCGDRVCEGGEFNTCPADCCGDGVCQGLEHKTCPNDCPE